MVGHFLLGRESWANVLLAMVTDDCITTVEGVVTVATKVCISYLYKLTTSLLRTLFSPMLVTLFQDTSVQRTTPHHVWRFHFSVVQSPHFQQSLFCSCNSSLAS